MSSCALRHRLRFLPLSQPFLGVSSLNLGPGSPGPLFFVRRVRGSGCCGGCLRRRRRASPSVRADQSPAASSSMKAESHVLLHRGEARRRLEACFVHVEGAVGLDLQGMKAASRAPAVAGVGSGVGARVVGARRCSRGRRNIRSASAVVAAGAGGCRGDRPARCRGGRRRCRCRSGRRPRASNGNRSEWRSRSSSACLRAIPSACRGRACRGGGCVPRASA